MIMEQEIMNEAGLGRAGKTLKTGSRHPRSRCWLAEINDPAGAKSGIERVSNSPGHECKMKPQRQPQSSQERRLAGLETVNSTWGGGGAFRRRRVHV